MVTKDGHIKSIHIESSTEYTGFIYLKRPLENGETQHIEICKVSLTKGKNVFLCNHEVKKGDSIQLYTNQRKT